MMYEESEELNALTNDIQVYRSTTPLCELQLAPINTSSTSVEWTRTLTSLTGTMTCNPGYVINGHPQISCNVQGKWFLV